MLRFDAARARRATGVTVVTVLMTLAAGASAAQASPMEEAQPVTTPWVCLNGPDVQFTLADARVASFEVPQFDNALGDFQLIEVTQSMELVTSMTVTVASAGAEELIRIYSTHSLWTNIPPALPLSDEPPTVGHTADYVAVTDDYLWAEGIYPVGFSDLGTEVLSEDSSFSSTDSGVWVGDGTLPVTVESHSYLEFSGVGGNGIVVQSTLARADLCYRYTYLPVASDPEPDPDPEPPLTPDEPTDSDPAPSPEPELQELPSTGGDDRLGSVLPLALVAATAILGGMMLRQRTNARTPVRPRA